MLFDTLQVEYIPFRWSREDVVPKGIESVIVKEKLVDFWKRFEEFLQQFDCPSPRKVTVADDPQDPVAMNGLDQAAKRRRRT
jgi:hypothetical protein